MTSLFPNGFTSSDSFQVWYPWLVWILGALILWSLPIVAKKIALGKVRFGAEQERKRNTLYTNLRTVEEYRLVARSDMERLQFIGTAVMLYTVVQFFAILPKVTWSMFGVVNFSFSILSLFMAARFFSRAVYIREILLKAEVSNVIQGKIDAFKIQHQQNEKYLEKYRNDADVLRNEGVVRDIAEYDRRQDEIRRTITELDTSLQVYSFKL